MNKKEKFIETCCKRFNNKFNYSLIQDFENSEKTRIKIICPIHGEFETTPKIHIHSKYGCRKCADIANRESRLKQSKNNITNTIYSNFKSISNPKIVPNDKIILTIYCLINKINNKIYIGKTVRANYKLRFIEHYKNSKENKSNQAICRAINKYGWDNFDKIVLFQSKEILNNTPENKSKLNDLAIKKETHYIQKYNSTDNKVGYNLTSGGDGVWNYSFSEESKQKMSESHRGEKHWNYGKTNSAGISILQFDLDFNFVKEWNSMSDVIRANPTWSGGLISRCCANYLDSYKSFIWIKKKDYYDGYLQKYKSRVKCKSNDKTVLQYDFSGNFINKYISAAEAGKAINKSTVSHGASGRDPHVGGYIWIYEKDFSEELLKNRIEQVKKLEIYQKSIQKQINE